MKKFSHSLFIKGLVFILVILSFAGILTLFVDNFIVGEISPEMALYSGSYWDSRDFNSKLNRVVNNIGVLLDYRMPSTEKDQSKGYDDKKIDESIYDMETNESYNDEFDEWYSDEEIDNWHYDKWYIENVINYLSSLDGVVYFASNGLVDYTNIDGIQQNQLYVTDGLRSYMTANNRPMHDLLADREIWESYPLYIINQANSSIYIKPDNLSSYNNYSWISNSYENNYGAFYIAYTDDYLTSEMASWEAKRYAGQQAAGLIIVLLAVLVLSFIYLLAVVGRNHFRDREVDLDSLDRLYTEINLILCAALIGGWGIFTANVWSYMNGQRLTGQVTGYMSPNFWLFFLVTAVIATLGLVLVLSLVRNFKNRSLVKNSFTYRSLAFIFRNSIGLLVDLYRGWSTAWKIILAIGGYSLALIIVGIALWPVSLVLVPAMVLAAIWYFFRRYRDLEIISKGLKEVRQGNLNHRVIVDEKSLFGQMADDINNLGQGMSQAIDNELKSERMKTELITNVSHDIRTPLTSILSYVGLLKVEKDEAKRAEYIEIIEQKSLRLKSLTDDLFEAAKATSGNMPVELSQIDIIALIEQGLGELDDKIQSHELDFRFQHPEGKVLVQADGKLVWRAVENLLSNIFKYALTGSRVYIEVIDQGETVELTFKNISADALNISPDQLMERFVRGDEARSSQGSGLGLSITKSLIEIQTGIFQIDIDGDLFKAIISLPKCQDDLVRDKIKEDWADLLATSADNTGLDDNIADNNLDLAIDMVGDIEAGEDTNDADSVEESSEAQAEKNEKDENIDKD